MVRRVSIALAVLLAIAGAILLFLRPAPEPVYQGKSVSEWIDGRPVSIKGAVGFSSFVQPFKNDEREAVRALGTSAVPAVIERLRRRDSGVRRLLVTWAAKQNVVHVHFRPPAYWLNSRGLEAAQILGPDAASAVPYIRPFLNDTNVSLRVHALNAIGRIGTNAQSAAPELFKVLRSDPERSLRLNALDTLGYIRLPANLAFDAVANAMSDPNYDVRIHAMQWFMGRAVDPAKLAPVMIKQLQNPDPLFQTLAMRELCWMKNDATNAIPLVEQLLGSTDLQVRLAARGTLERLTGKHQPRHSQDDAVFEYNFSGTPVAQAVQEYRSLVDKPVTLPKQYQFGQVQIYTVGAVTKSEAIALIEWTLKNQLGLVVDDADDGTLVVRRPGPAAMPTFQNRPERGGRVL